jgi:hypothetical protein
MEIEVPDPLCVVVENMSYEDFMVRTITLPARIDALLDRAFELVYKWLEGLLVAGFGPVFPPSTRRPRSCQSRVFGSTSSPTTGRWLN